MKSAKAQVVYKFVLLCTLLAGMTIVLISGLASWFGLSISLMNWHFAAAAIFALALFLHIYNRKNKVVKIYTQFMDLLIAHKYPTYCNLDRLIQVGERLSIAQICQRFQLDQQQLINELAQGRIVIRDVNQPLRQQFPHNDEKIFATMSIVLKLAFN